MICDRLQPGTIEVFAQRWLHRLPLPFGPADQRAGYWWEISMRQVEVSRTIVFDAPRHARGFFEALAADNLGIGRPHNVEIIFGRRGPRHPGNFPHRDRPARQRRRPGQRVLQALPDVPARAPSWRAQPLSGSRTPPSMRRGGGPRPTVRRSSGHGPGPCALCQTLPAATGFTSKNPRVLIAGLLGSRPDPRPDDSPPAPGPRLNGVIRLLPRTNRYTLTAEGIRIAVFYTNIYDRLLVPAHRREPAPGTTGTPCRASGHHPPCQRLRQPRTPSSRTLKLDTNVHNLATKDR